jgi:tRNA (mo5U34)-methyltransferase
VRPRGVVESWLWLFFRVMIASQVSHADDLRRRVNEIGWFHSIDLGNGLITPGSDKSASKLRALHLPALAGKTVLDVGASDGFFSFAAERAGAARVVAVEPYWSATGGQAKAGFDLAHEVLNSKVEPNPPELSDLYNLTPENVGTFDVVLMLGVLYHLRDPLLALERLAGLTNELLVVETLVDSVWAPRPVAAFYPGSEMNGDATNWWGPNPAAVVGMLRASGFREAEIVGGRSLMGKVGQTAYNAANIAHSRMSAARAPLNWAYLSTDRAVAHARR